MVYGFISFFFLRNWEEFEVKFGQKYLRIEIWASCSIKSIALRRVSSFFGRDNSSGNRGFSEKKFGTQLNGFFNFLFG